MAALTPMMQQYFDIKAQYEDCILFFRLGDFYEMFFEDAKTASKELEITLTGRDCGQEERAPMCGVPFHAAENYIQRLIEKGYKVAICEQVEDVSQAKGIVKRDVIRVVTPGTIIESSMLDEKKNNYILSVYAFKGSFGLAAADISTGDLYATSISMGNNLLKLFDEISRYSPSEIIVNSNFLSQSDFMVQLKKRFNAYITSFSEKYFEYENAREKLVQIFPDKQKSFNDYDISVNAAGALLFYIQDTQKNDAGHIKDLNIYSINKFMILDMASRRNLELCESLREKSKKGTLLWVLDKTVTSMGGRLLRKWIEQPLFDKLAIEERLDGVEELKLNFMDRQKLRDLLKGVYDIERLTGKIVLGHANCRDLTALKTSLTQLPQIKLILSQYNSKIIKAADDNLDALQELCDLLDRAIIEEPPLQIKEGGIIKDGYNEEVDKLRKASTEGKTWLANFEQEEKEKTGIKSLKVGFNKVFGYFIEVTKSYFHLVPQNYVRKQTLANCERFITEDLKKIEDTVLGAEERVTSLEYSLFIEIRDEAAKHASRLKATANSVALLDTICSLSEVADRENFCKPTITNSGEIIIKDGRHPVVEKVISDSFVPNDTHMDCVENRLSIITGPNMAGKSTFMRQVALIVLMAHAGSFVPAETAEICLVDRIFTRVGASDDLASGQSTFMVEMTEVSNILENATQKSLLILDEIGRGTSTYDGLSIAWAVVEYICDENRIGAKTLFATHYHELTELENRLSGVKNYCIAVSEKDDEITFLRKIIRGGADESYGIQVAKLAGLPNVVIERSKELLKELEDADIIKRDSRKKQKKQIEGQIDIFSAAAALNQNEAVVEELRRLDVTAMTPLEAMNAIYTLQQKLRKN